MNKYLQVDSTYRDRSQWPNPTEFDIVPYGGGRRNSARDAMDYVSKSTPIFSWSSNRFDRTTTGTTLSGQILIAPSGGVQTVQSIVGKYTIIFNATSGTLQELTNYYRKAVIRIPNSLDTLRINSSRYIGSDGGGRDMMYLELESNWDSGLGNNDGITITDPTEIDLALDGVSFANPQIFVPSGNTQMNAYVGYILYNETRNQFRTISAYDSNTGLLTLDTINDPPTTWTAGDNFSIRRQAPINFTNGGGATTSTIDLTGGNSTDDFYVGMYVRVRASTTTSAEFYNYVGNTIVDQYPDVTFDVPPVNEIRRIIDYDGTTNIATVMPPFTAAPSNNMNFEILPFSHDNFVPFKQIVDAIGYYEVELLSIILPNILLRNVGGNELSDYAYLTVQFTSNSGAQINSIITNNPHSQDATFVISIVNSTTEFIKMRSEGTRQCMYLRPTDTIHVSVRLPNGEPIEYMYTDTSAPYEPIILGQTMFYVSFRKASF